MNLEELINKNYDSLTVNDREMAENIFKDKRAVKGMNSTQLAAYLHVSRTTLVRFMKKLGIDSFSEFKLLLDRKKDDGAGGLGLYDLGDILREYHLMIDELKKNEYSEICESIYRAETVYLYGSGNEQKTIAEEFKRIFITFGKCCVELFDMGEAEFALKRFKEDDIFIAISLSGESSEALKIVKTVQKTGINTVSLTRWKNNSLARLCRENLYVGTKTVNHSAEQSYEMVAAFYILLDILSVRYLEYVHKQENGYK